MPTPTPTPTAVELRGPELLLTPWSAELDQPDLDDLRIGLGDPEQARWNPRAQLEVPTEEQARAWLARVLARAAEGTLAGWAARDPRTGRLLGHLAIREIDQEFRTARVGYWTMPAARGRGVATGALLLATAWAFAELDLHRMELGHAAAHGASCAIARKGGYRLEGTLREAMPDSLGHRHDLHLHARLATDPLDRDPVDRDPVN
ncbi:GNAT family N-acetyltransferase [Kitasatospora azatica]|uniref:GNAT family N-acetyltransferase n=1 Tax=Kitasatospora azatica TaxID=58347 RepID=UPI000569BFA7|nr:GNAT family N-acetyltransferase [Kitasatospora azatica]